MNNRPKVFSDFQNFHEWAEKHVRISKNEENFAQEHRKILDELHDIAIRKNRDYGSSFSTIFQEFGLQSSVIRLADKFHRLKTLAKQPAQVKDESIRDTLMDMANYCVLTVMELDKQARREEEHAIEMNKAW